MDHVYYFFHQQLIKSIICIIIACMEEGIYRGFYSRYNLVIPRTRDQNCKQYPAQISLLGRCVLAP